MESVSLSSLCIITGDPKARLPPSSKSSWSPCERRPTKSKVTMSTSNDHRPYWASVDADIEAHLKHAVPLKPPHSLFEPMRHVVLAAPRAMAPALCIAACELVGGHRDQATAAASTIHLMHAASSTRDHLLERLRPNSKRKTHHLNEANIELLIPDAIVPLGFELLAGSNDPAQENSDRILRVTVEITKAVGSQGMVDGQYHAMRGNESDEEVTCREDWRDRMWKKKEGALHARAGACGAILGGGNEEEIERLRNYGLYVGKIAGMLEEVAGKEVEELQGLALEEIQVFNGPRVDALFGLVESIEQHF